MDDQEIERSRYATTVFYSLVTNKEARLKYGAEQRLKMQDALKAGLKISGYRAEWLLDTIDSVLSTLIKASERFNGTYFNDMVSVSDLKDVLTSTINRLNKKARD